MKAGLGRKRDRVGDVLYYLGVKKIFIMKAKVIENAFFRSTREKGVQEKEIKKKPIDMIYVAKCKKICFKPIKIHSD